MALIKKANDLIQANYQLSINEQRLILNLLSTIQRPDEDFKEYLFEYADLVNIMNIDKRIVYTQLKQIAHNLLSNPIIFKEGNIDSYCNWCAWFKIDNDKKTVSISFHPNLKPYLLQLKKNFTTYNIKHISGFSSAHSFRIYEICKQYQSIKKRKTSLIEFKDILDIAGKYNQISALKAYVINPAIKDINEHSDILISAKYFKTRRSITDIEFTISNKLENCKNEKQEEMIIEETKEQSRIQEEKIENQEKSAARTKIWNEMSDADKQKNYPGNSGYIKFMASFTSGHC